MGAAPPKYYRITIKVLFRKTTNSSIKILSKYNDGLAGTWWFTFAAICSIFEFRDSIFIELLVVLFTEAGRELADPAGVAASAIRRMSPFFGTFWSSGTGWTLGPARVQEEGVKHY